MRWVKFLMLIGLVVMASCTGLSVFQSPEIVPTGKMHYGVGGPLFFATNEGVILIPLPEFYARYGIAPHMDASLRMPFIVAGDNGAFLAMTGDIRFGTQTDPGFIAAFQTSFWSSGEEGLVAFQPGLFFTGGNIMAGAQLLHLGVLSDALGSSTRLARFYLGTRQPLRKGLYVNEGVSFIKPLEGDDNFWIVMLEVSFEFGK